MEVRFPDPTANPYLCFSSIIMAGLDGITNKIHPGPAADHEFLIKGGGFSKDFIESYLELKQQEQDRYRMTPHPVEFDMYYSC